MNKVFQQIENIGVIPVVVLKNVADAVPLANALLEGGLPCAEITFRTEAAEDSIKLISDNCPDILLGAGTVTSIEQADKAIAAGAKFLVSPGLNPKVVQHCLDNNYPICPGIMTPSELETAINFDLDIVKFFPAELTGGVKMIKAISAPYPSVKFIPTGGINADNVEEYLMFNKVLACGGSWMVKSDLITSGHFDEIVRLTREAKAIINEIRGQLWER